MSLVYYFSFVHVFIVGSDGIYQLELDISSVHFLHHPLFSYEHALSSELEQTYQKYSNRDKNAAEYYNLKVHS